MHGHGEDVVLLPPVEIPGLAIAADAVTLRPFTNALVIAAGTAAHNKDLLLAVELVDCLAYQKRVHCVGGSILVNAGVINKSTTAPVITQVASALVILAMHKYVVCGRE